MAGNRKYRKLSDKEHVEIVKLANTGLGPSAIARIYNIHHTSVLYILKKSDHFIRKEKKIFVISKKNKKPVMHEIILSDRVTYPHRKTIDTGWYQRLARKDLKKRKAQTEINIKILHKEDERIKNMPRKWVSI